MAIIIDKTFCEFLEYEITKALAHSDDEKVSGIWCDGIILDQSELQYSHKFINDNRQTKLKAFIGKDGQTEYELTLKFGDQALSRYLRNLDIRECLPNVSRKKWFNIDISKNKIEIQLD